MDDKLDALIKMARAETPSAAYHTIEQRVWNEIDGVRKARQAVQMVFAGRAAAVAGALVLGIAGGGVTAVAVANETQETSAFSITTELAPSTLLDHHG